MKFKLSTLVILAALIISGSTAYAQNDAKQNSKVYQIETRLDN